MTLTEAIKSNKPYRRQGTLEWYSDAEQPFYGFKIDEILAEDWELFDASKFEERFDMTVIDLLAVISALRGGKNPILLSSLYASILLEKLKELKNKSDKDGHFVIV